MDIAFTVLLFPEVELSVIDFFLLLHTPDQSLAYHCFKYFFGQGYWSVALNILQVFSLLLQQCYNGGFQVVQYFARSCCTGPKCTSLFLVVTFIVWGCMVSSLGVVFFCCFTVVLSSASINGLLYAFINKLLKEIAFNRDFDYGLGSVRELASLGKKFNSMVRRVGLSLTS